MKSKPPSYPDGMPAPPSNRLQMIVTPDFLRMVDEWRRRQEDLPNRSEAIRRLTMLGARQSDAMEIHSPAASDSHCGSDKSG